MIGLIQSITPSKYNVPLLKHLPEMKVEGKVDSRQTRSNLVQSHSPHKKGGVFIIYYLLGHLGTTYDPPPPPEQQHSQQQEQRNTGDWILYFFLCSDVFFGAAIWSAAAESFMIIFFSFRMTFSL